MDLAKGASAVSGPLGMPRVPGFTDLAVARASFGGGLDLAGLVGGATVEISMIAVKTN